MNFPLIKKFLASLAIFMPLGLYAQQVLQLVPGKAPSERLATTALAVKPGETLKIENLIINDDNPKIVNLELKRSEIIGPDTQFIVMDEKGPRIYPLAFTAHFVGKISNSPKSHAFVTVSPTGEIRAIIHNDGETIINELLPTSVTNNGKVASRAVDHTRDFPDRDFSCGVDDPFVNTEPFHKQSKLTQLIKAGQSNQSELIVEKIVTQRRADIIIDSDYELFQKFGTEAATFTYITNLLTYVSSRYQAEVAARFNLKQIVVRTTSSDPWTQVSTRDMLYELQAHWNSSEFASIPRHHVHLLSGKSAGGGIAYLDTLGYQGSAYGVSADIRGDFTPSNPQVIWDSVVVAHEIGHAFGSGHTHTYDAPYIAPTPNTGGAIDCCYSDNATGQCGVALGGAGITGYLPGLSSTTGGGGGQGNGTIMSYCHYRLSGGISNIAWTFGTDHPYGVNASRVPTVMLNQAQTHLPIDGSGTYDLSISKSGSGTVTSIPAGINCGLDCNESYPNGTSVILTATPSAGYSFSGWTGGCSGTGSCTVNMSDPKTIGANFIPIPMGFLSVAKVGTGSGTVVRSGGVLNCGSTCTEALTPGTVVSLTATPVVGSNFAGWSGGGCSGTGGCAFTINANTTATAIFNSSSGGPTVNPLLQTNLSGTAGSLQYYSVTVPANAKNLTISIAGGIGDADLYVKYNQVPTTNSYDCRPNLVGNNETCTFPTPASGTYHIMLRGWEQFSGITLSVGYQTDNSLQDITPIINLLLLD